ncbi:MAG: hypothetical protein CM1200mP5_3100 [Candidatus Pelagibacterales bacterium]|nr:MAG: hypothetical protein CM1200mP5_3100 [Pelagibacterales bacterium]
MHPYIYIKSLFKILIGIMKNIDLKSLLRSDFTFFKVYLNLFQRFLNSFYKLMHFFHRFLFKSSTISFNIILHFLDLTKYEGRIHPVRDLHGHLRHVRDHLIIFFMTIFFMFMVIVVIFFVTIFFMFWSSGLFF